MYESNDRCNLTFDYFSEISDEVEEESSRKAIPQKRISRTVSSLGACYLIECLYNFHFYP